jgi:predicted 3-demethylubiquinone-9 3-methyltransferase (glyoxalase superfamily)
MSYLQRIYFMDRYGAVWQINIKSLTRATVTEKRRVFENIFRGEHQAVVTLIPTSLMEMKEGD